MIKKKKLIKKAPTCVLVCTSLVRRHELGGSAATPPEAEAEATAVVAARFFSAAEAEARGWKGLRSLVSCTAGHFSKMRTRSATDPRVRNGRIGIPVDVYCSDSPECGCRLRSRRCCFCCSVNSGCGSGDEVGLHAPPPFVKMNEY